MSASVRTAASRLRPRLLPLGRAAGLRGPRLVASARPDRAVPASSSRGTAPVGRRGFSAGDGETDDAWIPPELGPSRRDETDPGGDGGRGAADIRIDALEGLEVVEEESEILSETEMDRFLQNHPEFLKEADRVDDNVLRSVLENAAASARATGPLGEAAADEALEAVGETGPEPTAWRSARRKKLKALGMSTPSESKTAVRLDGAIDPVAFTLLSEAEITACLNHMGGQDVVFVEPKRGNLGVQGLIVATGTSPSHLKIMADVLVRNMRQRKLQKRGVRGAKTGPDGDKGDHWITVDCGNFLVHLQDELTRKSLNLEKWWSEKAPSTTYTYDDSAMDDFCEKNPIPDEYFERFLREAISNERNIAKKLSKMKLHKIGRGKNAKKKPRRRN